MTSKTEKKSRFGILKIGAACFLSLGLFSGGIWASDFHSPRTAALGGAGHAGPLLNDGVYLNPSFASFLPSYSVSGNLLLFHGPDGPNGDPSYHGRNYNVS